MRISDWSSDVCSSDLRGLRHHARILSDQHRDRCEDDLLAILSRRARAKARTDRDIGDVGDPDRNAAAGGDDDLRQVALIVRLPRHPDQYLFAAALDIAGAETGRASWRERGCQDV